MASEPVERGDADHNVGPLAEAKHPRRPVACRTMRAMKGVSFFVIAVLLGSLAGRADAARSGPNQSDSVYRCRSASGQTYVGQAIPPECMDQDVEVLDAHGRVVRTIPGRHALEQQAQEKAAQDAAAAKVQRDKTLLATYLTVADIERLRDQRVELLSQQDVVTRQYIANLRAREERLMSSAQQFRPYSANPNAPPLPEQMGSEIVNTVKGLQVYQQELAKNTEERERVTREFASDIARFKELKGIK
jgi:hypothetical protein